MGRFTLCAALALGLGLGACGGDAGEGAPTAGGATREPAQRPTTSPAEDPVVTAEADDDPETASPEAGSPAAETPAPEPRSRPRVRRYAVLDVVDGDTVTVAYRGGESVRVIGIDTPETVHPSVPDECGGAAASRAAGRILTGMRVGLVFDRSQGRRDYYGRLLAYLQVPGVGDFGRVMVRRGLAAEYTYDTAYRHRAAYQRAESRAQASGRGLWGHCGGPDEPAHQPKRKPKPASGGNCKRGYDPCVPPYPPDLDCPDVNGPVRVTGSDPHGLDADGDGSACET
ncbi:MAG: thermonuclease family protein [Actinomycetes bacterium]